MTQYQIWMLYSQRPALTWVALMPSRPLECLRRMIPLLISAAVHRTQFSTSRQNKNKTGLHDHQTELGIQYLFGWCVERS